MVQFKQGPEKSRLPNLDLVVWPEREFAPGRGSNNTYKTSDFEPRISRQQYSICFQLLDIFEQTILRSGIAARWFIHAKTLLGSIRHHDIIPWDNHLEIMLDVLAREEIRQVLENISSSSGVILHKDEMRDKLYLKAMNDPDEGGPITNHEWSRPYIDMCYYQMQESGIDELDESYDNNYTIPRSDVFPLLYRPLGRKWVPAPFKPIAYLRRIFDDEACTSPIYSRREELLITPSKRSCKTLASRFAFVQRWEMSNKFKTFHASTLMFEELFTLSNDSKINSIHKIPIAAFPEKLSFIFKCNVVI